MKFKFKAKCVIEMEHREGDSTSVIDNVSFNLGVSDNLDKSKYIGEDELPTEDGSKALTLTLLQGLIGNIHQAHEKGFWDSAEHLRYIIKELERGFTEVVTVKEGRF